MDREQSLWDTCDLAKFLGVAPNTIEKSRLTGNCCPFLKVGRLVKYDPAVVQCWLKKNERSSTSDGEAV